MFDPEKEVPSLELCKRLKKLGYPQDGGGWYWYETEKKIYMLWDTKEYNWEIHNKYAPIKAPTIPEMMELLGGLKSTPYNITPKIVCENLISKIENGDLKFVEGEKKRGENE